MKDLIYDSHTHLILSDLDIPKCAFGWITPILMKSDRRASFVAKWLHRVIPFTNKDGLDRLSMIVKQNILTSHQRCTNFFKDFDCANVLLIDLEGSMNAGKTKRTYEQQIIEAIELKKEFNIKIFLMINPNRENMMELIEKYYNFIDGYKYYSSLTGPINNSFVDEVLTKYPKKNIILHTTNTSPIYDRTLDKEICGDLCHPIYCLPLIQKFKNINFIYGHAGANKWLMDCVSTCYKYKNAYIDTSFFFESDENQKKLEEIFKIIPTKILWSTDFYMIKFENFLKIKNKEVMIANNYRVFS